MGRKKRENKTKTIFEKETKTINFDVPVLNALEERSRKTGVSVSDLVNRLCRHHYLTDVEFFKELEKQTLQDLARIQYDRKMAEYDRDKKIELANDSVSKEVLYAN